MLVLFHSFIHKQGHYRQRVEKSHVTGASEVICYVTHYMSMGEINFRVLVTCTFGLIKKKKKGNPSDVFILCAASKTGAFYMTFVDLCGRKNKISDKFDFKSEKCRKLKFMKNRGTILYFIT